MTKIYKKKAIPAWLKEKIAKRDNYTCQICGKIGVKRFYSAIEMVSAWAGGSRMFEIDHIIPEFLGGTADELNLQLACQRCNRSKGYSLCT